MTALLLIITFLSFFLSALVFLKKNKNYPDFLLAYWFLFTAFHTLLLYGQNYNFEHGFPLPSLIGIEISLVVVHPVWIFIYVLCIIRPDAWNFRLLWHFLPFVLINLLLLKTFYLKPVSHKISCFESAMHGTGYVDKSFELTIILIICVALGYLIAGYLLLRRHRRNVKNYYSNLEGVDLGWLRILLHSIAAVIIGNSLLEMIRNYLDIIPAGAAINIGYIFILAGISWVGMHGLRQTSIIVDYESAREGKNSRGRNNNNQPKAAEISTIENSLDEDYEKLSGYMETEKPFRDFDLNLVMLANQTGFKTRYLSQLINQKTGKNFFDFVNGFRIGEFKKSVRLPENKNFTLLSIAYDCGFNSKATFNRVFKNHTGITPSEFFNNSDLT